MDDFNQLYNGYNLSRLNAQHYISAAEASQLRKLDLSSLSVKSYPRSVTNCLALDKLENRYLLCGTQEGVVSLFDLQQPLWNSDRTVSPLLFHAAGNDSGTVASLQWYPEDTGAFLTASMRGDVSIFDTNAFVKVATFTFPGMVVYSARMRAGPQPLIAVALQDGSVRLCDPRTRDNSQVLKGHARAVTRVEWSPFPGENHVLTSAGMDGAVRTWDVRRAGGLANAVIHSFDWRGDFRTASRVDSTKLQTSLLSARGSPAAAGPVVIADSQKRYQAHRAVTSGSSESHAARAHDAAVTALQYTSCGRFIITAGNDRQLRLWQASTGELLPVAFGGRIVPPTQLPFDLCVAESSFATDDVLVTPVAAGSKVECPCNFQALNMEGDSDTATGTEAPPIIAKEGDMLMIPVHSSDGQPMRILRGHLDRVTSVVYRRSHQQLISAGKDGMVFVWEAPRPKRKDAPSRNRSRHHALYYGTAGGRYSFEQMARRVLGREPAGTQHSGGSSVRAGGSGGVRSVRRELPVTEATVVELEPATQSTEAGPRGGDGEDNSSSDDNWSEDDDTVQAVAPARGRYRNSDPGGRKSKAARTIENASRGAVVVDGTAQQALASSSSGSASFRVAVDTDGTTSGSGRFVPPIIRQYLSEARRNQSTVARPGPPPDSAGGQSSSTPVTAPAHVCTAVAGRQPKDWSEVEGIFETAAPSALGLGGFMPPSNVFGDYAAVPAIPSATLSAPADGQAAEAGGRGRGTGAAARAGATGRSGADRSTAAPLSADERYRQWVRQQQQRAKGGAKK